ncbi:MAG: large conductance mechanosensitive channel protein MscL [Endomicrobiaceae bacterium]|nr:large conductance mechanosensitive channel protein MscL [Endomicrobiaceae bacterium]
MIKNFVYEFKKFISRGNVLDMAVGIIIGGAFTKIVNSLVTDIIMPPLGVLLGNIDFSNWFVVLKKGTNDVGPYVSLEAAKSAGANTLNVGFFINSIITFTIVAFAIFALLKTINKLKDEPKEQTVTAAITKECPFCCSTININATKCPNCTSELK